MPAIQPARMKIQVAQLSETIRQPEGFVQMLHQLLDFYADRTYHPGQSGEPPPLLATYKTPAPVFRQVEREIASLADGNPSDTLALIDALWAEPTIEFRLLAIALLGRLHSVSYEPVIERVQSWLTSMPEDRLLKAILEKGLTWLRRAYPEFYFQMIEEWLKAEEIYTQRVSLLAMISLLDDPKFENLPIVFRLLTPLLRIPPPALRQDLVDVLRSLIRRYPHEASFILRENLSADRPDTAWLIRQVLTDFPADMQHNLHELLGQIDSSKQ